MKQLFTLLIAFFFTANLYADCKGNGLWVFPKGKTVKQNTIFVLTGYADSQGIILKLNKKHNVYLKSGQKKIKLLITETFVGEFKVTQAVLKPEKELEAGLVYTMHIDNLPGYEDLTQYNNITQKNEPIAYRVLSGNDFEKPKISSKPKELEKQLIYFGCGPSTYVVFSNPAKDKSELLVRVTVKNLKTKKETTYYVEPDGKTIKVGHGMCAGEFKFENGDNYEAEFSFMDASGNLALWAGTRIKFTKPIKETIYKHQ